MENKDVQWAELPEKGADIPVDLQDPGKCGIQGLIRQEVKVQGKVRNFLTYIADDMHYNAPCLVVAPPAKEEPKEFLERSGLAAFADENKVFVSLLEADNGCWDFEGNDADFMNAVYKKVQAREYYVVMQDCIYALGIGDGATIAHQAAMKMASEWSGLATFGACDRSVMKNAGDSADEESGRQTDELFISGQKCQLPVWMFLKEADRFSMQAAEYWKVQNRVQKRALLDENGTEIYMPETVKRTSKINDDNISQVRITKEYTKEMPNETLLAYMWEYIGAARRHRGYGGKVLRYYRDPLKNGATYHTMVVDGIMREWYEYVPDSVREKNVPVPLMVVMHGRGGNGESFFDITDMSIVAEERQFIALFPTGDFYQVRENGLKNVRIWNGSYEGTPIDSLKFIRMMIENVKQRFLVDAGRIYACGQSSGGWMTSNCAMAASDLFTAVAPWSGVSCPGTGGPFGYKQDTYFETKHVPFCILVGDRDNFFSTEHIPDLENGTEKEPLPQFLKFLIQQFSLDPKPATYCCHPITYYVWKNAKGTPMLKVGIVKDMPHANYAEESRISYDEFLVKFSRNAQGKLEYMGQLAE